MFVGNKVNSYIDCGCGRVEWIGLVVRLFGIVDKLNDGTGQERRHDPEFEFTGIISRTRSNNINFRFTTMHETFQEQEVDEL